MTGPSVLVAAASTGDTSGVTSGGAGSAGEEADGHLAREVGSHAELALPGAGPFESGEARKQLFEHDSAFEPGEHLAETEVPAVAEAQVPVGGVAADVKPPGV